MARALPRRDYKVNINSRPAIYRVLRSLKLEPGEHKEARLIMMNFILGEIAERHYEAFTSKSNKMTDEFRRRWARLRPNTIAKKGHDTIGVETGHMMASFTPGYVTPDGHYIAGHQDQIAEATAYSLKFGTAAYELRRGKKRPKAKFFHGGTKNQVSRAFWRQREVKRWVKDGIAKALPAIVRMMQREDRLG